MRLKRLNDFAIALPADYLRKSLRTAPMVYYNVTESRTYLLLYDVPLLVGGLGDFLAQCTLDDKLHNYVHVNEALRKIAEDNPMTGFLSGEGLGAKPDNLHFNAKALHEFGLRYFDEFEKYRDENKVFEEKPCVDDALRTKMEEL